MMTDMLSGKKFKNISLEQKAENDIITLIRNTNKKYIIINIIT